MGSLSGITVSQFDDPFSVAGSSSAAPASHLDSRLFVSVCSVAVFEFLRHLEAGALAQQFNNSPHERITIVCHGGLGY